jgi:hypothetical protein
MTASTPPDLNTKMTERARTVWSLGDFARAGAEQVIVGELLARAIDIHPGERVLDVAAGTEARVRELLGDGVTGLTAQVLSTDMCGFSPAARVEFNRAYVGPTKALFDRLGPDAQQVLAAELAGCLDRFNRAADGTLVAPADYLQVVATRAAG